MSDRARLSPVALGLACACAWAALIVFTALAAWLLNWGGALVNVVSSLYLGYAPTLLGAAIGGAWALVDGFVAGFIIAWLYNRFSRVKG